MDKKEKKEKKKDGWYFAAATVNADAYDPYEGLDEGTVILDNDTDYGDIIEVWTKEETKWFCKKGNAHLYTGGPVTIGRKFFKGKTALEAGAQKFGSLEEMANYLKDNRGALVYQILHNTISDEYMLRSFSGRNHEPYCMSPITYLYNYLTVWNRKV